MSFTITRLLVISLVCLKSEHMSKGQDKQKNKTQTVWHFAWKIIKLSWSSVIMSVIPRWSSDVRYKMTVDHMRKCLGEKMGIIPFNLSSKAEKFYIVEGKNVCNVEDLWSEFGACYWWVKVQKNAALQLLQKCLLFCSQWGTRRFTLSFISLKTCSNEVSRMCLRL